MVRPMRKTRAPTQSQRAIGHITALPFIATMFVMYAMVGRSTLQFKMPRLDAYPEEFCWSLLVQSFGRGLGKRQHRHALFQQLQCLVCTGLAFDGPLGCITAVDAACFVSELRAYIFGLRRSLARPLQHACSGRQG